MTTNTTTPQEWEKLKNRGNVSFANKQYREAAELYRDAIKLRPGEASLYSNRCLCTCKLYAILSARNEIEADERERMLVEAQKDAERVVGLKPAWWKGWFRRGVVASLRRQHLKSWKYLFRAQKVNDDPKYVKMLNQELRKARRLVPKRFELNEDGSTVETIELSSTPSRPNALKGNPVYEAFAGRDYQGIHPLTHFERIGGPRVARCENACFFLGVQWAQAFCHARRDVFYETPGTQEAMGRAMQRRGIDLRSQRAIETMNRLSGMIDPNNNMCMFATAVFQTQSNFVSCLCAASSNSMFQALALGENPSLGIPNVPLNDLVNWNTFFNGRTPPELVFGKTRRGATRSERGATDVLNQLQWIKINMQNCAMRAAPTMRNPSTGQYVASTLLHGSAPNVCQLGDLHTPSESNSPEAKRATELIEASMQSMTPQEAIKTLRRALNEGCEWQIDGMNLPLYRSLQRSVSWAFRSALIHAWSYAIRKRFAEALASAKWAAKFIELADLTLSPEFSVIRYYPGSPCVVLKRNDHGTRPHCHTRGAVFCHSMYRAPLLFVLHINTMMRKMCKTKKGNELYSTDVDIECCLRLYENIEANREVEQRGLTASQKNTVVRLSACRSARARRNYVVAYGHARTRIATSALAAHSASLCEKIQVVGTYGRILFGGQLCMRFVLLLHGRGSVSARIAGQGDLLLGRSERDGAERTAIVSRGRARGGSVDDAAALRFQARYEDLSRNRSQGVACGGRARGEDLRRAHRQGRRDVQSSRTHLQGMVDLALRRRARTPVCSDGRIQACHVERSRARHERRACDGHGQGARR